MTYWSDEQYRIFDDEYELLKAINGEPRTCEGDDGLPYDALILNDATICK